MRDTISASFSVIICAYTEHRWADLVAAVRSVQAQTRAPLETIIVIDHQPELLARAKATFADALVIENSAPRGLSGARNSGLAVARGQIVAFLDDDAIAAPDWLETLLRAYHDAHVMAVGGSIEARWDGGSPRWFPHEFDWVVGCTYRGLPETSAAVRNLIGCNMSLRREVFEAVGGFRVGIGRVGTLPVGCEETELCIRARQHWPQRVIVYEPAAKVAHRVPPQRATFRYFVSRCVAEGYSKALVSQAVGSKDALAAERAYTTRTLPRGVVRGLRDVRRLDVMGLARAAVIVVGLGLTAGGYLFGLLARRATAPQAMPLGTHREAGT